MARGEKKRNSSSKKNLPGRGIAVNSACLMFP